MCYTATGIQRNIDRHATHWWKKRRDTGGRGAGCKERRATARRMGDCYTQLSLVVQGSSKVASRARQTPSSIHLMHIIHIIPLLDKYALLKRLICIHIHTLIYNIVYCMSEICRAGGHVRKTLSHLSSALTNIKLRIACVCSRECRSWCWLPLIVRLLSFIVESNQRALVVTVVIILYCVLGLIAYVCYVCSVVSRVDMRPDSDYRWNAALALYMFIVFSL